MASVGSTSEYAWIIRQFWPVIVDDVIKVFMLNPIDLGRMGLSWDFASGGAHDSRIVLDDWTKQDEFIEKMVTPGSDPEVERLIAEVERAKATGRYVQFGLWCAPFRVGIVLM